MTIRGNKVTRGNGRDINTNISPKTVTMYALSAIRKCQHGTNDSSHTNVMTSDMMIGPTVWRDLVPS